MTLTKDDRDNVATALTTFADVGDVLINELRSSEPPAGSPVHDWFYGSPAATHAVPAFHSVATAVLSGGDHLRSLNHLARVATTSAVTVARGAVEAYATASHLATATDAVEFAERHLSALRKEYGYLIKYSAPLTNREGATLHPDLKRADVEVELQRLGLELHEPASMTARVREVLDRAAAGTSGAHVYSGLSSVAHSQLTGVGAFVSADPAGRMSLAMDRDTLMNLVYMTSAAAGQALDDVILLFGDQPAHRYLLEQAEKVVSEARSTLVASAP